MRRCALIAALAIAVVSCGPRGAEAPVASAQPVAPQGNAGALVPPPPAVHVAHRPPTPKDVIDAAIASGGVPLTVSSTCANAGTEPSDATIGRYLAGFLAELSSPSKKNWIETKVEPGRSTGGDDVSICTLTLRHEDGDDRWGWGIRYQVRSSDGLVLPDSFSCVGAG